MRVIRALDAEAIASIADALVPGVDREERVAVALARALIGRVDEATREGRAIQAEALAARAPELVCDAASVRALGAANAGDLSAAVDLARRASMMSRTEALPEQETLANLVLARVRRLTGRPFLATRILSALARFATPEWNRWIAWELVMASGHAAPASEARGEPAALLASALEAARRGDRAGFDAALEAASASVGRLSGHAGDVVRVRAALDSDHPIEPETDLGRWRFGVEDGIPLGLQGLGASAEAEATALVLARPEKPGVRLLGLGAALAEAQSARRLSSTQRKQGRTDTALAVLALAGDGGLSEEAFFRKTYGFAFSRTVHGGVLDVLIHRARAHLAGAGDITRGSGGLVLSVRGPLLFVDPRSGTPIDDRVLQLVAKRGQLTAKDTSNELNIPLRSAQAALEALIATGACNRVRTGRTIEYRVDDTTFQEPTNQRS
jgi:hypothetical protein